MPTSAMPRMTAPALEPSTDFPTDDDGEPIHRARLRMAALVIAGALVAAAVVGFVIGYVL
jgi:F0F1-type ATP synthase assembly protein I